MTYVRNQLEYCSALWHPQCIEHLGIIEGVQRAFTSKISGLSHMDYWERLEHLCLMLLQRRRERFIVIMMLKLLRDPLSNDLNIQFRDNGRTGIKAVLLSYPRGCRSAVATPYDASFAYVCPKLWNVLPTYFREIRELDEFKRKLTEFVLFLPDRPPVPGYSLVGNRNSLE